MSSESSESSLSSSGRGPSGMMISSSLSSSSSSSLLSSTGAAVSSNRGSGRRLTSFSVRHTGRRHAVRVVNRIKVDTPRRISQLPMLVVQPCLR